MPTDPSGQAIPTGPSGLVPSSRPIPAGHPRRHAGADGEARASRARPLPGRPPGSRFGPVGGKRRGPAGARRNLGTVLNLDRAARAPHIRLETEGPPMFIQTESTPNPATLKFLPGEAVLG